MYEYIYIYIYIYICIFIYIYISTFSNVYLLAYTETEVISRRWAVATLRGVGGSMGKC